MKNKILNTALILAAVVVLVVFACYVRVGATADSVAVMRTTGMTCSSCVKKITTVLQAEKGVAATEVDLAGGYVIAGYDSKQVAPERLAQAVQSTGFSSKVVEVLTPAQFKAVAGRDLGALAQGGCGGCGSGGCGMKQATSYAPVL